MKCHQDSPRKQDFLNIPAHEMFPVSPKNHPLQFPTKTQKISDKIATHNMCRIHRMHASDGGIRVVYQNPGHSDASFRTFWTCGVFFFPELCTVNSYQVLKRWGWAVYVLQGDLRTTTDSKPSPDQTEFNTIQQAHTK
jgi:hypothetical protein